MECIVTVGVEPGTGVGRFAGPEYAGQWHWLFRDRESAQAFADKVTAEFDRVRAEDPHAFVYGTPFVTVDYVHLPVDRLAVGDAVYRAARNWYMPLDDRAESMVD